MDFDALFILLRCAPEEGGSTNELEFLLESCGLKYMKHAISPVFLSIVCFSFTSLNELSRSDCDSIRCCICKDRIR